MARSEKDLPSPFFSYVVEVQDTCKVSNSSQAKITSLIRKAISERPAYPEIISASFIARLGNGLPDSSTSRVNREELGNEVMAIICCIIASCGYEEIKNKHEINRMTPPPPDIRTCGLKEGRSPDYINIKREENIRLRA
jgi:hypothetical protein